MTHQLGDQDIEEEVRAAMNAIAIALDRLFNGEDAQPRSRGIEDKRKWSFVLLVAPFNTTGRCNFISNGADRRDIVVMMKEMIARFEGQPEMEGHG